DGARRDLSRPRPVPGGCGDPHRGAAALRGCGGARARYRTWPVTGYTAAFEPAMRLALAEARRAGPDDVPVGAVVLDEAGAVITRARNRREADRDPTAHAEIVAIRQAAQSLASWRLTGLNHRPGVIGGVLAEDCGAVLRDFFAVRRGQRQGG